MHVVETQTDRQQTPQTEFESTSTGFSNPFRVSKALLSILMVFALSHQLASAQNAQGLVASPSTITFSANNPNVPVSGSSLATVSWSRQGKPGGTWTLSVGTIANTFTGCTTVPRSAVSVRCASATHSLTNQNGTAACSATSFTTLPGTVPGVLLATGAQASSGNNGNGQVDTFTITVEYSLADSWRFIPNTCPLSLTYTVVAP